MVPDGPCLAHAPPLLRPRLLSPPAALQNLRAGSLDSEGLAGPRGPLAFVTFTAMQWAVFCACVIECDADSPRDEGCSPVLNARKQLRSERAWSHRAVEVVRRSASVGLSRPRVGRWLLVCAVWSLLKGP